MARLPTLLKSHPLRMLLLALVVMSGFVLFVSCTNSAEPSPPEMATTAPSPTVTSPLATHTVAPPKPISPLPTNTVVPPAPTFVTPTLVPTLSPVPIPAEAIPVYTYTVVNTYPHDREAFTQGLIWEDSFLYEGTGLRGRSSLRKVELETGQVVQLYELPPQYFGEGITIYGDRIYQLTWQSRVGLVYDKDSFELLQEFQYPTEGWGLTHDGEHLIMSDGTATLYFLDPVTLVRTGQLEVKIHDDPLTRFAPPDYCFPWGRRTEVVVYGEPAIGLNELEYIQGEIYANVWQSTCVARIDAQTGQLRDWIQLGGLLGAEDYSQPVDVLNGIAYDAANDRLFVTGKLWPKLFEIQIVPVD
jgi:glutamine cyclotransferase